MAFFACPECGCRDTHKTIECRPARGGDFNRRRRECNFCSYRFTTYESYEDAKPQPNEGIPREVILKREIDVYIEGLPVSELEQLKAIIVAWLDKNKQIE